MLATVPCVRFLSVGNYLKALLLTDSICGVACVAPAARHDIYTVLSAFNF